jgi:hypothetical protein
VAKRFIRRGQDSGAFDATLPPAWLLTPALALGRAAEDGVKAGRMTIEGATRAVRHSFLRLFGIQDHPGPHWPAEPCTGLPGTVCG